MLQSSLGMGTAQGSKHGFGTWIHSYFYDGLGKLFNQTRPLFPQPKTAYSTPCGAVVIRSSDRTV